ncbi:hypothetical protein Stsp01_65850 [Streptomyces sp. NBRC 13847]|nr:hypothetical protein Stsp01_65850 [Streptomyces sp. NBRC 13847]
MPDVRLFAAIIYVLVSGCAWWALQPGSDISKSTVHRHFLIWSRAGVWGRLYEALLRRLVDVSVLETTHVQPQKA